MTRKSSTTNGFISLLGSFPTQVAMLLAFVSSVYLPRDEEGAIDWAASPLYHCVWIMHLGSAFTVLWNQHFPHKLGIFKYTLNTFMALFNVIVLVFICMEFFIQEDDGKDKELTFKKALQTIGGQKEGEETDTEVVESQQVFNAEMLRGWYAIEVLMFCSNIVSNIIFVFSRSCSKIRILGTRSSVMVLSSTDMIEEQQVLICLFSCFIAPFLVTLSMFSFGFTVYQDVTNDVWEWLFNLMLLQLLQSILVIIVTFAPYRRGKGDSCFNKCCPAFHNVMEVFLFIVCPSFLFVAYFFLLEVVETKVLFLYFTFTIIHTILFTIWFFMVLLELFEGLKAQNSVTRKQKQAKVSRPVTQETIGDESPISRPTIRKSQHGHMTDTLLPENLAESAMTFREDMFSLLFISLVKPEYKQFVIETLKSLLTKEIF